MITAVSYQFERFLDFAEERVKAGKESAIARTGEVRVGEGTPLAERAIYSTDKTDFVGMTILRGGDTKRANDEVRELFRKSIVDMFGGEGNIPDSVKDAMLLKDYGQGKPLTARRILEVYKAIEALDRTNIFHPCSDSKGELAKMALEAGYTKLDFGRLNTAANFLMKAQGIDAKTAFVEVAFKGTPANRAMNAGSFFMKDEKSFMLGYDLFNSMNNCHDRCKYALAEYDGSANVKPLAVVADNLKGKYDQVKILLQVCIRESKVPEELFSKTLSHLESTRGDLRRIADSLSDNPPTNPSDPSANQYDRVKMYKELFDRPSAQYFNSNLNELKVKLRENKQFTPEVEKVFDYIKGIAEDMIAEEKELRAAYEAAVGRNLSSRKGLTEIKAKIIAAAREGGQAKGTPGMLTEGVLEKLDLAENLRKDPFGAMQKIDKLCADFKRHGLKYVSFSQKQKADLKALLLTFLQKEKGEKAFKRLIDKCEAEFINRQMFNPYERWNPMRSPDDAYKHFMENREELLQFDPSKSDS